MTDYTKNNIGSGYNTTTSLNAELEKVETAVNSKLDKTGGSLSGDLSMESNDLLNVNHTYTAGLTLNGNVITGVSDLGTVTFPSLSSVTYTNTGTGATGRPLQERLEDTVSVLDFGAVGDGVTDDTAAIQAAINANGGIYFPEGVYLCGEVNLPESDVDVFSFGATLQGTSGTYIFRQVDRAHTFKMEGLNFTGNAKAFFYDSNEVSLPNNGQYYEFLISNCTFKQPGSVIAIHLYGSREGLISNCYFEGNDGIRVEAGSVNTKITDCQFKNCNYGIYSLLTASVANAEGVIVSGAVMLGCSYGIRADRTTGVQIVNSMIDYCDSPIYLVGAESVVITGNYISTRTAAPAIHSVINSGYRGSNHIISGNRILDNHSTTGSACIRYEDTDFFIIKDNILSNYASYALVYTNCTQAEVSGNITRNRSGLGTNSILALVDDSSVRIYNNRLTQTINRSQSSATWRNTTHITESSGEATVANGTSSINVTHGLSFTPLKSLISLTPTTGNTGGIGYYVSAITSTTFTITTSAVVGSDTSFAWTVKSRA